MLYFSLCRKTFNVLNEIWLSEKDSLEYYGEVLQELNSKPYVLVIESYLLKSMSSTNIELANKFKVY